MQNLNNQLVLRKDDYELLTAYVNAGWTRTSDRRNAEALKAELKKASLVNSVDFPPDVVRLNSVVTIKAGDRNEVMQLEIVIPENANIKEKKISILAPLGTALLGFRKGQKIKWQVPAGIKTFTILDVINNHVPE